jgi:hypothetical protein
VSAGGGAGLVGDRDDGVVVMDGRGVGGVSIVGCMDIKSSHVNDDGCATELGEVGEVLVVWEAKGR